jgi:hypothetical protein
MVDQWLAGAVIGYDGNGDYIYIVQEKGKQWRKKLEILNETLFAFSKSRNEIAFA